MAYYLVKAKPSDLESLRTKLDNGEVQAKRPYGEEMHQALLKARVTKDGWAMWEEKCYCNPPLKQERSVLDQHFTDLTTKSLEKNEGWKQIEDLPSLWKTLD